MSAKVESVLVRLTRLRGTDCDTWTALQAAGGNAFIICRRMMHQQKLHVALQSLHIRKPASNSGRYRSQFRAVQLTSLAVSICRCTTASRVAGGAAIPGCPASETAAVMSSASASADGSSQLDIQSGASDGASAAAASSVRLDPESFRMRTLFSTWWVWVLAVALAIAAAATLARRRNVYVLLNRRGSEPGLPRFGKGKDHKEAEPY